MTTWAIGDLQGCYDPLQRLLVRIRFDAANDRLSSAVGRMEAANDRWAAADDRREVAEERQRDRSEGSRADSP